MANKNGSEINQKILPVYISLSLSLILFDSNTDMWIDSKQVRKFIQIGWKN